MTRIKRSPQRLGTKASSLSTTVEPVLRYGYVLHLNIHGSLWTIKFIPVFRSDIKFDYDYERRTLNIPFNGSSPLSQLQSGIQTILKKTKASASKDSIDQYINALIVRNDSAESLLNRPASSFERLSIIDGMQYAEASALMFGEIKQIK